jgi:uridylate kinase
MTTSTHRRVFALGGSLVVPDEVDKDFLKSICKLFVELLSQDEKLAVIVGGGSISRYYQKLAKNFGNDDDEVLDWIGIEATRLNARLVASVLATEEGVVTVFGENDLLKKAVQESNIIVSSGWSPGQSTDSIAVKIADVIGAQEVINLSNIDAVYDRDPKRFKNARAYEKLDWNEYRTLFPAEWTPGLKVPFDPVAASAAQKLGLQVTVMNGDVKNLGSYLRKESFSGTVIKS